MKIRRVTLLNLNSLLGEHTIDFTQDPIASAGLFAITGPTGAGKSTLLDAITLALYGRAARYGKEPNPNDMMSRHRGECQAEVEFETAGEIYRASWHLRRARGATEGKIQPPRRFVYNAAGEVLTQKIKEADSKIEEICGLDYERFMRSALLAQGEFARFLKSDANERAALLESLTGTTIYSDLSKLAHEEATARTNALADQERALGVLQPLSEDERTTQEKAASNLQVELTKARAFLKSLDTSLSESRTLQAEIAKETDLLNREKALATQQESAKQSLTALETHRAAVLLIGPLEICESAAKHLEQATSSAKQAREEASKAALTKQQSLAAALITGQDQITKSETHLEKARATATAANTSRMEAELWLNEHKADATLPDELPSLLEGLGELANAKKAESQHLANIDQLKAEREAADSKQRTLANTLQQVTKSLQQANTHKATAADSVQTKLAGRSIDDRRNELEALTQLQQRLAELAKGRLSADEIEHSLLKDRKALEPAQASVNAHTKTLQSTEKTLETLQRHLNDARLIANFDKQRAALSVDDPCPLCGAQDHPYCDGDATPTKPSEIESDLTAAKKARQEADATLTTARSALTTIQTRIASGEKAHAEKLKDLITQEQEANFLRTQISIEEVDAIAKRKAELDAIEQANKALEKATLTEIESQGSLTKAQTEVGANADRVEDLKKRFDAETNRLVQQRKGITKIEDNLTHQLKPFGLDLEANRELLRQRAQAYTATEKHLTKTQTDLKEAQAKEKATSTELKEHEKRVGKVKELLEEETPPDPGEMRFKTLDQASEEVATLTKAADQLSTKAEEREQATKQAQVEHTKQLAAITKSLTDTPFETPTNLRAAILSKETAKQATARERELIEEAQQLKGALIASRESLTNLRTKKPAEGEAFALLETKHKDAEMAVEPLRDQHADIRSSLKNDDQLRAKQAAAEKDLTSQRDDLKVWQQLAALIGSHDGKRFRVFAQGLSLDLLLAHANKHLAKLSDRYQLGRSTSEELGLEIIDLHQASTTRPMASLSGGESFLASLALALGLSDLAGRNVQIDSLFIDEGFGTLDSETLDTALSALESLRLQDKTIGVISHVEMLKERIGVQIAVERAPDGSSKLRVLAN